MVDLYLVFCSGNFLTQINIISFFPFEADIEFSPLRNISSKSWWVVRLWFGIDAIWDALNAVAGFISTNATIHQLVKMNNANRV